MNPPCLTTGPQAIAERIVSQGSVMTIAGFPVRHHLVGCLEWISDTEIRWFIAHGNSGRDARLLRFDEIRLVNDVGIGFLQDGIILAYLTGINESGVEDPEDYQIGWQIWLEVAPLHSEVVARAFAQFEEVPLPNARAGHVPAVGQPAPVQPCA